MNIEVSSFIILGLSLAKEPQCSTNSVVVSSITQKKKQHCCIGLITKSAFCNLHESGCQT